MVNRPEVTIAALWFDTGAFTRSYYTGRGMHFFPEFVMNIYGHALTIFGNKTTFFTFNYLLEC